MRLRCAVRCVCLLMLLACSVARAQTTAAPRATEANSSKILLVLPFENAGADSRVAWLGEGLAELSIERMALAGVVTYPRAEYLAAMEKLGLPPAARFTRATMLKIAKQINADYVMFGRYSADGGRLNMTANVLRVEKPALSPAYRESGSLQELMDIHARLAWQALRFIDPQFPMSQRVYLMRGPKVRLDAFEAHVRGLLAAEPSARITLFREAARVEPDWGEPVYALGREYFAKQDCASALIWFSRILPTNPRAPEAEFYAGLCHLRGKDAPRAETTFATLLQRLTAGPAGGEPRDSGMQDVLNNLAIAESRQGKWREAAAHWQRAQQLEPGNAGYWFNYAIGALRANDAAATVRGLREALRLNADDAQARALLIAMLERSGRATEAASEREACEAADGCEPTPAIRAIWKAPQAPASPDALLRFERVSESPEFFVRQREGMTPAPAPRSGSSLGGRQ